MNRGLFCFAVLILLRVSAAQQNLSPALLKQLQDEQSLSQNQTASPSSLQNFLPNQIINHSGNNTGAETQLVDSKYVREEDGTDDLSRFPRSSVYQKMLRNELVEPETLLANIPVYGYDIFSSSRLSHINTSDYSSVPLDYPLRTGDEILIHMWGRVNEEYRVRVNREGSIIIPRFGPVRAAGMSFETVKNNISEKIGQIDGVNVNVSMGELRPIGIFIVGEVKSPGSYNVNSLTSILNAIFTAGGITEHGSLRNIELRRNGRLVSRIDFYDFLLSGEDNSNLRLQPGDVIFVPMVKQMAAVAGNVRRSALYELLGPTPLSEVLELAGGITPAAYTNRIQIERFFENSFQTILDLDSSSTSMPDFLVKDGDIVKIFPIVVQNRNSVRLNGNVLRPGLYQFRDGMKISDLLPNRESLLPQSYLEYGVILRKTHSSQNREIISFNLDSIFRNKNSGDNLRLQEHDEVVIYHETHFVPPRRVKIEGAVITPGEYNLFENMTIRDLILLAGGLNESASTRRGELYRREFSEENVITSKLDFSVSDVMNNTNGHNYLLQSGDRVFVRQRRNWNSVQSVTLSGQFVYPGTYIIFDDETLGELIERAGGFREEAHLAAAVFTRQSVKEFRKRRMEDYRSSMEEEILRMGAEMAVRTSSDPSAILKQQLETQDKFSSDENLGRVLIDLTQRRNYYDFPLEDGDELFIPKNMNTISVLGEVINPATFKFDTSNPYASHYIQTAGGYNNNADKRNTYIIRANGSIVNSSMTRIRSVRLEPGDAVVVPTKISFTNPHRMFVETADAAFKITGFLSALVALIVTINSAR
ncbi:Capsule polysaccharide export protein [Chitinispirillum alkaliphilum]|nr:Capsule polysaccharide export protein [Chitinispirillum alkaliphilum]